MYTFILVRFEIRVDREPKIYYFHPHPFKHRFKYPPKSSSERGYSRFKAKTSLPSPLSKPLGFKSMRIVIFERELLD